MHRLTRLLSLALLIAIIASLFPQMPLAQAAEQAKGITSAPLATNIDPPVGVGSSKLDASTVIPGYRSQYSNRNTVTNVPGNADSSAWRFDPIATVPSRLKYVTLSTGTATKGGETHTGLALIAQKGYLSVDDVLSGWYYDSPQFRLPVIKNPSDRMSIEFVYTVNRTGPASQDPDAMFGMEFYPQDNYVSFSQGLIDTQEASHNKATSSSWIKKTIPFDNKFSGKQGDIGLVVRGFGPSGFSAGWTAIIADIKILYNGVSVPFPIDQTDGKCPCELGAPGHIMGDPVNTLSGTSHEHASDISVTTAGPPLTFERSYSSLFADTATYPAGILGAGWRHSFEDRLIINGTEANTVILETWQGNRLRFYDDTSTTDPVLLPPYPGVRATLLKNASGYTLTAANQRVEVFDTNGLLKQQIDPQGHIQNLDYTSTGFTVTDQSSNRVLTFVYKTVNGQNRLKSVSDNMTPVANTVTYGYDSNGDLNDVATLSGVHTGYTYTLNSTRHNLYQVKDILDTSNYTGPYKLHTRLA